MNSLTVVDGKTGTETVIPENYFKIDEEGKVTLNISMKQIKKLNEGKTIRKPFVYGRSEEEEKEKHKEYMKIWQQNNREHASAISKEYYKKKCEKDPEFKAKQNELKKQKYWENREKILERQKEIRRINKERLKCLEEKLKNKEI